MPDLWMCTGDICSRKAVCFRHTAQPNPYNQSYFLKIPLVIKKDGTEECEFYIHNRYLNYDEIKSNK